MQPTCSPPVTAKIEVTVEELRAAVADDTPPLEHDQETPIMKADQWSNWEACAFHAESSPHGFCTNVDQSCPLCLSLPECGSLV